MAKAVATAGAASTPVELDERAAELARFDGDINEVPTFDDAIARALARGLTEEQMVFIASPYTVLNKDKDALLQTPFFINFVRFTKDKETDAPYCVIYAITRDNEPYAITDGSTGIYRQLVREVNARIKDNYAHPMQDFIVANGLRKSEYKADNGQDAVTYYLA